MSFLESVYVALFLFAIVFAVLFCLYVCIKAFSFVVEKLERAKKSAPQKNAKGAARP